MPKHKHRKYGLVAKIFKKIDDSDFPHKYDVDPENNMVQICLYRYREFTKDKFLANTIIPWTVEWLYFYEIWLATREWCGGGEHPINISKEEQA